MSHETSVHNVPFTPFKKRCDETTRRNSTESENVPFTISSRKLSLELPTISINVNGGTGIDSEQHHHQLSLKDGEYLPDFLRDKFDCQNTACKPLEEVDPEFINKETFLVVGRDGKVHRLSAKKSTFIFNHRLRRIGILISWNWQLPVLTGIILSCLCFSFVLPNYASNAVATVVWNFTRYIFEGLLFGEICANILARGILVSEFTYLRSPWDWLDVTTFTIIFINFFWRSFLLHSLEGMVLFKFIPIVPALKTGFQLTIQVLKNLVPALIYSLLTLWILVMVGLHIKNHANQLQNGNSTNISMNCEFRLHNAGHILPEEEYNNQYQNETTESPRNYDLHLPTSKPNPLFLPPWNISSNSILNTSFNNECLENYRVSPSSIIDLTFQTMSIITYQGFGTVSTMPIDPLFNHFLYVIMSLIFGTFGVSVLTAASVGFTIFSVRPYHAHASVVGRKVTCLPNIQCQLPTCDNQGALIAFQKTLFHPFVELFMTIVMCLDVAFMSLSIVHPSSQEYWFKWIILNGQEACMLIYVMEFLFKLCLAPSVYLKSWWSLLDFGVAIISALNRVYPVPTLLQFRALKITSRWPTLQLIFYVFFKSIRSRLSLICILALGLFFLRYAATNYIYGSSFLSNFLALVMSQSFLINDWTTVFERCKNGGGIPVCFATWLLEIVLGIVFVSVIFVTVINYTCDLVTRPVDCCCENDNYKNLEKAISLIKSKSQLIKCCSFKRESRSASSRSMNQEVTVKVPAQLPVPTANGGPNDAHQPDDGVRSYAQEIKNPLVLIRKFQFMPSFSIGMILMSSAASILEFDNVQRISPFYNPRFIIDLVFVCYFMLILIWKLITKSTYKVLKSPPWLFDFLIISAVGFTIYTSMLSKVMIRELPAVKLITTLTYFRGLMLVTRVQWLKVGLIAITSEVRLLWRYLIGLLLMWMCIHWLKNNQSTFSNKWLIDGDAITNITLYTALVKISIKTSLLLAHVLLFGVFVGVVMSELLKNELLASFMTPAQCVTYKDKKLNREKTCHIPAPKSGLCNQITHYLTLTHAFDITVMAIIICDCLVITFHPLATSKDWRIIWGNYPAFIVFTYACELTLKGFGWRKYFWKSSWNIFDLFVVAIGIIDLLFFKIQLGFVTADTIRFLRILRIFQLQLFTKNAKLVQICYSSLLKVLPCIGNLLCLYGLFLFIFTTIGLNSGINMNNVSSRNINSVENLLGVLSSFNNIIVSLIFLPIYGSINSFHIAQTPPCWTDHVGIYLIIYLYSFIVLSHILLGSVFAIVLHEILKTLISISHFSLYSKQEEMSHINEDVNESKYKHTNGGFLNCDFAKSPDDPDSVVTMLTPIEPLAEDPLGDEDKYPIRMSANGYILHVEAIVTTV